MDSQVISMRWFVIVLLVVVSLQGCTSAPQSAKVIPSPEVVIVKSKAPSTQVVIIVSEDIPAYTEVAKTLSKLIGQRATIQYLFPSQLENIKLINNLKNIEHVQFVSVGLNASIAAKSLTNKQVIFCQVYNYQDYSLITSRHKGVSMLPSINQTFNTWRAISPAITRIGVISGPGLEDVIDTARISAKHYGINLIHETVKSDKEFQYAYKKMSKKVQGYWLLPDNRVLSEHTLRDIMNFSVRNSKQVAVFNEELLKLGGLLSIKSDPHDIAQQVYERLEKAQSKDMVPGPDIVFLEKMSLQINSTMANNLGLEIPAQYKKSNHAP